MNLEALKKNALATIAYQKGLADKGDDFSAGAIAEAEELIRLVDEVVPQITEEEWARINQGTPGIDRDMSDCKDIKEKYGISWNDLRSIRFQNRKTTPAQRAATERYEAKTKAGVYLKLNKNTDADILDRLDQVESKQGYIKELIRADIEKKIGQK